MDNADIANRALVRIGLAQPCCEMWVTANMSGTDNEGYQALVCTNSEGWPVIGYGHDGKGFVVKFCPWCAAPKAIP